MAFLAACLAVSGCQRKAEPSGGEVAKHVDVDWVKRTLLGDTLAHWLAVSPTDNGFFQVGLDRQWRPAKKQEATLVSQGMMIHVMLAGYEATGERAYLDAARKGADFLRGHFRDDACGGWFWAVHHEGTPFDADKHCVGQAAAIVALADLYRVTGDAPSRTAAMETLELVMKRFRDRHGGLVTRTNRDFSLTGGVNGQAPMMHMMEAALALHDATGEPAALDEVRRLAEFVFTRLYDAEGGYVPESYDEHWRPIPAADGGRVDLGCQFQWAYLLSRAVEKGLDRKYLDIGNRLIDFAIRAGYDQDAGGVWSFADYDGQARRHDLKVAWRQCQMCRGLIRYASGQGREDLWAPLERTLGLLRESLWDGEFGGLFAEHDPGAYPPAGPRADKGGLTRLPHHEVDLVVEVLQIPHRGR